MYEYSFHVPPIDFRRLNVADGSVEDAVMSAGATQVDEEDASTALEYVLNLCALRAESDAVNGRQLEDIGR